MFLAVALPVFGAGAINLLLLWVHAPKVILILRPPPLIQLPFLLAATVLAATRILPFFDPKVRNKQAMTKRTPPPFWHKDSSPGLQTLDHPSMRGLEAYGIHEEKKNTEAKKQNLSVALLDWMNQRLLKKKGIGEGKRSNKPKRQMNQERRKKGQRRTS
jgi:hypothetical protein